MHINDDFSKPVIVQGAKLEWIRSPAAGVERRMLFRIGDELARATSIVRYAPGSAFARHVHGGGEEILVLAGTFQDEQGDYPAGSYLRNPPGSSHVPASQEGCTIFVRLWQFRADDHARIIRQPGQGLRTEPRPGAKSVRVLFEDACEEVRLEEWNAANAVVLENRRGLEFFVVAGELTVGSETLGPLSWGRLPAQRQLAATVGPCGATIWLKDAPILHPDLLRMPE